ncbi:MAG TPA: hypothetical protein PLS24_09160, partial [Sedimentisphaerales bacterium]|nr:hypothetical protein [Sedimentisphaerales bacterium]
MRSYSSLVSAILTMTLFWTGSVQAAGPLYINELLASNATSAKDPQGHYDDWIELYNASDQAIDCGGMYLTDDAANPRKWQV